MLSTAVLLPHGKVMTLCSLDSFLLESPDLQCMEAGEPRSRILSRMRRRNGLETKEAKKMKTGEAKEAEEAEEAKEAKREAEETDEDSD